MGYNKQTYGSLTLNTTLFFDHIFANKLRLKLF